MSAAPQEAAPCIGSGFPKRSILRYGWILAPLSLLLWYSTLGAMLAGPYSRVDFNCMYVWGLAARSGINPYVVSLKPLADSLHLVMGGMNFADYPPLFVIVFEPLSHLSPNQAYLTWTIVNVIAVLATLGILLWHQTGLSRNTRLIIFILALFYFPLTYHFYWAQVQVVTLLLVVIANAYLGRKRDASAGVAIAIGGLLKIFPFYLLGYIVLTRRWRAFYYSFVAGVVGTLITIAVLGPAPTIDFVARLLNRIEGGWLAEHRFSEGPNLIALGPVAARIYRELVDSRMPGQIPPWLFNSVPQLLILGLSCYSTARMAARPERQEWLFALWTATIVLVSPTSWIHYMVLLIFPYIVLAKAAVAGHANLLALLLGLVSYLLTQAWALMYAVIELLLPSRLGHFLTQNWFCLMTLLTYVSIYSLAMQQSEPEGLAIAPGLPS